jgi:hypothetical protein
MLRPRPGEATRQFAVPRTVSKSARVTAAS